MNWLYSAIYTGNVAHKNCQKPGEKEHPVGLPRDVQYYWRMVRDLNPRRSYFIPCPISSRMHSTALPTILILFLRLVSYIIFSENANYFIWRLRQLYTNSICGNNIFPQRVKPYRDKSIVRIARQPIIGASSVMITSNLLAIFFNS